MHDDPLSRLEAADLLCTSAELLYQSQDPTNAERLLLFVESQGLRLLRIADKLRATRT